jgi:arylformamidase
LRIDAVELRGLDQRREAPPVGGALTDEMEWELSAMQHIERIRAPLLVAHGTLETPEFQRQARDFEAALRAAGKTVTLIVAPGYNHFEVGETIGHPYAVLGRAAMQMMKLDAA